MEFTLGVAAFITSISGIASFVLGIVAEVNRMPPPTPVELKDGKMKCNSPHDDHSVYLGYAAVAFIVLSAVVGSMHKYLHAGGVKVPVDACRRNALLKAFHCWAMFMEGLALYMFVWPLYKMHRYCNITYDHMITKCPTADKGFVAGGALSSFGAALLWVVVFIVANNCMEDFSRGDDGNRSIGPRGRIEDEVDAAW